MQHVRTQQTGMTISSSSFAPLLLHQALHLPLTSPLPFMLPFLFNSYLSLLTLPALALPSSLVLVPSLPLVFFIFTSSFSSQFLLFVNFLFSLLLPHLFFSHFPLPSFVALVTQLYTTIYKATYAVCLTHNALVLVFPVGFMQFQLSPAR